MMLSAASRRLGGRATSERACCGAGLAPTVAGRDHRQVGAARQPIVTTIASGSLAGV